MVENRIRVLLVHAYPETTSYITALLSLERDITLVGSAATAAEGLRQVGESRPDVVLISGDLPDQDSAPVVRQMVTQAPRTGVVALLDSDDAERLRRFMQAGARSFLLVPFGSEQLISTIREVHKRVQSMKVAPTPAPVAPAVPAGRRGKLVAIFSPKGGVGKSTIAVNTAVAMQRSNERQVVLVDGGFSFGDLHLFLNIKPDHTIVDFIERGPEADVDTLQMVLRRHSSGIAFLARPVRPEHAEMVTADNLRRVLDLLQQAFDMVVYDCAVSYDERVLMVLDRADLIVLVVTPEVGTLYNATAFYSLAKALGYHRERIMLVVNRYDSQGSVSIKEVEETLANPVAHKIPSRWRDFCSSLNSGVPLGMSRPSSDIVRVISDLAELIMKNVDAK
jgi:pilus assembly protein CpaE